MAWKTYRDRLMLFGGCILIPGLWVTQGMGLITLDGPVNGTLITIFVLIWNFYFRKTPDSEKNNGA